MRQFHCFHEGYRQEARTPKRFYQAGSKNTKSIASKDDDLPSILERTLKCTNFEDYKRYKERVLDRVEALIDEKILIPKDPESAGYQGSIYLDDYVLGKNFEVFWIAIKFIRLTNGLAPGRWCIQISPLM